MLGSKLRSEFEASKATTVRRARVHFAAQLALVITCWAGANVVAIFAIDAYEFRQACREAGLSAGIANRFQTVSVNLSKQGFPARNSGRYKLLSPAKIQAGEKYPVVLYLHGAGERGDDGLRQLRTFPSWLATAENRKRFPCFLLVPQCPDGLHWNHRGGNPASHDEIDVVNRILHDFLRNPKADPDRVYAIGYSMGAYGVWELAARYPDALAAVIPIAGAGNPEKAKQLVGLPIWAFHGKDDEVVNVTGTRNMIEAIRDAGGGPNYSELVGVGHGSLAPALKETDESLSWLFAQSRKSRNSHG